jgi:hypothetical protein
MVETTRALTGGLRLLQNLPHPRNIVPRMAPIALGIQIAKNNLSTELNFRDPRLIFLVGSRRYRGRSIES